MENPKNNVFACTYEGCGSVFNRPYRLQQHELVHKNIKLFSCALENCTKSYTSKSHLDRHIKSVHKKPESDLIHSCPECLKKFANRQNLKRHINRDHLNININLCYQCDICKRKFKKKYQLNAHMYRHNGIKAFRCEVCPEEYITLYEKRRHMKNHRTYACEDCPEIFDRWSKYVKHKKTNHISKEYICDDCGKSFKKKNHILRHLKMHTQKIIRTFLCPFDNCERRYSRNSNLRQHILMKHERLTFECSICKTQLSTKSSLQKHILNMHESKDPKIRKPKTLETGRKFRKDKNTIKCKIAALKLSGLPVKPEADERISECIIDNIILE